MNQPPPQDTSRIRPIALAIIQRPDGAILVNRNHDPVKGETFFRPLGGGIEFGERAADCLRRELREEIGAEITNIRYRATIENIFEYCGRPGHEVLLIFDADLADSSLYDRDLIEGETDDEGTIRASWKPLAFFTAANAPPLYPTGLLDVLRTGDNER